MAEFWIRISMNFFSLSENLKKRKTFGINFLVCHRTHNSEFRGKEEIKFKIRPSWICLFTFQTSVLRSREKWLQVRLIDRATYMHAGQYTLFSSPNSKGYVRYCQSLCARCRRLLTFQIFIFSETIKSNVKYFFSKFLMNFLPTPFKNIYIIITFLWTIIVFSKTGIGGSFCFVHCLYKLGER
jgi:hypothetical protein